MRGLDGQGLARSPQFPALSQGPSVMSCSHHPSPHQASTRHPGLTTASWLISSRWLSSHVTLTLNKRAGFALVSLLLGDPAENGRWVQETLTPPRPTSLLEPRESGRREPNLDSFLGLHLPSATPSIVLTQNIQNFVIYEKAGGHRCISYNKINLVSINEEDRIANVTEAVLQLHLGPA